MPSIIPGWVYSLFASLIVGVIVVTTCSVATVNVRNDAQSQQLTNIEQYVAAQSLILLNHVAQDNQSATQYLDLPTQVGDQVYWICLVNDSSGVRVDSGLGLSVIVNVNEPGVSVPAQVNASGVFVSTYGRPFLQCSYVNQTVDLTLSGD